MHFDFENGINPFNNPENDKLGAYKGGGYVRRWGKDYMVYLNPTPYQVEI